MIVFLLIVLLQSVSWLTLVTDSVSVFSICTTLSSNALSFVLPAIPANSQRAFNFQPVINTGRKHPPMQQLRRYVPGT
jgi:hypothetical protein